MSLLFAITKELEWIWAPKAAHMFGASCITGVSPNLDGGRLKSLW